MHFETNYKPELCVSTDASRSGITAVHIEKDGDRWIAVATDGHCLANVPVVPGEDSPREGFVSSDTLKAARRVSKTLKLADVDWQPDGASVKLRDGSTVPNSIAPDVKYPNWRQVVPDIESGSPDWRIYSDDYR